MDPHQDLILVLTHTSILISIFATEVKLCAAMLLRAQNGTFNEETKRERKREREREKSERESYKDREREKKRARARDREIER